jgi:AraC family transcriptional regulator of adaptative response/methylated-DNA-[protein]-cysteine methyltransferase
MNETIQQAFPDDETCWQAFLGRDPRYNGVVYYGIRSTGIYCKPACPARRAGREQVVFFAAPEQAEAGGYRPCRRCHPRDLLEPQAEWVQQACALIEAAERPLSLEELAAQVGVSPYHFHRVFKSATGLTPRQYAAARRVQRFKELVRPVDDAQGGQPVSQALYAAGYGSSSQLYSQAAHELGMTPAAYRRGGKDMDVHYTIVDCPLGRLLLAGTERGVCAVSFGEEDAALERALAEEYPAARLERDAALPGEWLQALQAYLAGDGRRLDLPLDLQATTFQLRVWEALRRIPYGERRSYTQVAQEIGQPAAVRAVASACAANPVSLVTPCHRVVRSDGSLGGYRWGLERKRALLAAESARAAGEPAAADGPRQLRLEAAPGS